ncbi:hypothetical protein GUJ93_ZPchr0004g39677 [Zizania palustris]|uniref:Chloride channel protein n=1 Tax=Zizania palustris TaxID=103762 RepID=A0A8J5S0J3_ZIZPA|nr:hypothetical protein GUJ93_ZPchr0004g39677 [Zizania palustris]KAG8064615.1 hypothetical protein GUJ93_ZPchr0004g39677 [Zizania palustris]KAG8064616.1 hypothetical protein GUJ93_ZPchr0004g39677 [Zizania palustris]
MLLWAQLPWLTPGTIGRSGNFKNFQCPPGHYSGLAPLFFNTNDDAIRNLFISGTEKEFRMCTLFVFLAAIYCRGLVTNGVSLFHLVSSSLLSLLHFLVPYLIMTVVSGLFALLGAASFLGGTMRMTVSVCVILVEFTNDHHILLPLVMLLVFLISKIIADSFDRGVYDQIAVMKGLPFMEAHAEPQASDRDTPKT